MSEQNVVHHFLVSQKNWTLYLVICSRGKIQGSLGRVSRILGSECLDEIP